MPKKPEPAEQPENENKESKSPVRKLYLTSVEAAAFFNVARPTLTGWPCPKVDRNLYDLKALFDWWQDNVNKPVSDKDASSRERLSAAKAELAEIELAERKGELQPKADYHSEWATRAAELRQSLESAEFVLAPMLVGVDSEEKAAEVIAKFFKGVLESYCRQGRFTPTNDTATQPAAPKKGGKK